MSSHDLSKIFDKLTYQRNFFELSRGLMFKNDISISNESYIFILNRERKAAITMMFVFFPIDVVWLNSKFQVIDSKENLKPFSFYTSHKGKAKYFVEMPLDSIKKYRIKIGDRLKFPL
jgi:uncharacterized membrane protein (UPF0127 family)